MRLTYRIAEPDDLSEICRLARQAIVSMEQCGIAQWDAQYPTEEDFRNDMEKKELYVGLVGDEIAVIYVLNQEFDAEYENGQWRAPDAPFYVIHRLCVRPEIQNSGIAKETVRHIMREVLARGGRAVRLDVFSENPYALKLYRSLGFCRVGEAHWRKGRFYLMERCLSQEDAEE